LQLSGPARGDTAPLVRLHSECLTGDVFGSLRCDCGAQLEEAQRRIAAEGRGAVIYLRQEGRGIGLEAKLAAYELQDDGLDTVDANRALGFPDDGRSYREAAWILRSWGWNEVRVLTNNPDKVRGLEEAGIRVVERVPLVVPSHPESEHYMNTKAGRMGHLLASAGERRER
ncbi:MAG TPA: GTP cyclohydrolase II, partial [Spirochaetia bacterium]|nr:GTP cyclohydrolase II [Spirochaetia bacterium]